MRDKVLISIDFETADYDATSACAVGLVRIENLEITESFSALIRPPNNDKNKKNLFTHIHGITWEDVKNEANFKEVWHNAQHILKGVQGFIAHNAPFDRKVMHYCCIEAKHSIPDAPFYCTLKASRKFLNLPKNKLCNLAEHFNIELNHHEALSDAHAAAKIFIELYNRGYNLDESICPLKLERLRR